MEGTESSGRPIVEAVADLVQRLRRDGRREYRPDAKQVVLAQCARPGVSIAAVTLANGLNANVVRRWLVEQRQGTGGAVKAEPNLLPGGSGRPEAGCDSEGDGG